MTRANQPILIELTIRPDQPELLEGLDLWLRLGLISDAQVRRICQEYLVVPLPTTIEPPAVVETLPATNEPTGGQPDNSQVLNRPLISRILSSLMAEISVVWLLFLGVFMVVVSSGVLAASQWQNFSSVGQYAILFAYTLAFWIASLWTQQRLLMTSRMLQIATVLIIPVNFWTIDGFNLWRSGLGLILSAFAAISLSAITWILRQNAPRSIVFNSLALCWLQLGWALPGFPLIATYIGTIGTAFLLFQLETEEGEDLGVGIIAIAFSILLLIGRAVGLAGVPLSQLGLALGVCGWLICRLNRRYRRLEWSASGIGLLVLGWLVAVGTDPPIQAIAISCLGIWLLTDRLKRLWQVQDLILLFFLGLQAYSLLWRLFPVETRRHIISLVTQIASAVQSWELIGLAMFPYIVVTLVVAFRLRRLSQPILSDYADRMALSLGIVLAGLSLFHGLVRSLYLLFSTLTLAIVLLKRTQPSASLIYLTHSISLLTSFAWIGWAFPTLNSLTWAIILIICMVAEWSLNLVASNSIWRRSAWYLGLASAALSYVLLFDAIDTNLYWGLLGLVTPTFLTFLTSRATFAQIDTAAWLSVTALLLTQLLTFGGVTPSLISSGLATVLMLFNTQKLSSLLAATITVGFGLIAATSIWQIWGNPGDWLTTRLAIALGLLWFLRTVAVRRHTPLSRIYTLALDGWAIALGLLNLIILTLQVVDLFGDRQIDISIVIAAILSTGAIVYRLWQQPSNLGFYGVAWSIELVVASIVGINGAFLSDLAIANLALGLVTQLIGDWRGNQLSIINDQLSIINYPYFSSWNVIPIIYAILGLVAANYTFTATTGVYTFAAALIGVGVGRRKPELKLLTYLSIVGISIAAYQLLIYQLLQASGGESGDGIVLLASLAAGIAFTYRLLWRWFLRYSRLTRQELLKVAHIHWGFGSFLALVALYFSIGDRGSIIWIGVTLVLAAYAIWQGRSTENWVYFGVVEASAAIAYLLYRSVPTSLLVNWAGAIAILFAYALYILPWRTWGWSKQPWQKSAAILPIPIVILTAGGIGIQSLLIVAGFYAWLAKAENRIRLSYLSILLADWAVVRLLIDWQISEPLWYVAALSGSLLYIAQVDPRLRSHEQKEKRHILRTLATGLFCLSAIYQSDRSITQGILTIVWGFGLILAGLTLRVRAFLYVGTATFMIKVLRQLWLFINNYSLLLWGLGIVVGLIFIWIAATFEARRSQVITLMQYWIGELETWE